MSLTRFLASFFLIATATTEIYTLSLHDALPIWSSESYRRRRPDRTVRGARRHDGGHRADELLEQFDLRSEEHTSELQSRQYLVCRLLLEKKKKQKHYVHE